MPDSERPPSNTTVFLHPPSPDQQLRHPRKALARLCLATRVGREGGAVIGCTRTSRYTPKSLVIDIRCVRLHATRSPARCRGLSAPYVEPTTLTSACGFGSNRSHRTRPWVFSFVVRCPYEYLQCVHEVDLRPCIIATACFAFLLHPP